MVIVCLNLCTIPRHFYALETKRCLQHENKAKRNTFLNNHYRMGREEEDISPRGNSGRCKFVWKIIELR